MIKSLRLPLFLASLSLLCCEDGSLAGGAGAGNPPQADVTFSFKANSLSPAAKPGEPGLSKSSSTVLRNPDGTFTVRDSSGTMLTLSVIEVRVQEIDIGLPKGLTCAQVRGLYCHDSDAAVKGPYTMDLMTGESRPFINFIKLPEGVYSSIGLDLLAPDTSLDPSSDSGSPRYNITIRGQATIAGRASRSFEIKLDLHDGLDFEDTTGFRIESIALNRLILKLNVDGWFAGADFSRCLDQSAANADSAGITMLQGDGFCDSLGLRIRRNIEASGGIENQEQAE